MTPARRVPLGLALLAGLAAPARGQSDRIVGLVRDAHGQPLAAAVRAFPEPELALPWLDPAAVEPLSGRTDESGRFSLATDRRAALWIDGGTVAALVAVAAPGVPAIVDPEPVASVILEDDAQGAHVRVDGIALGFVAGAVLRLPAGAVELLVETPDGPYVAGRRLAAGAELAAAKPTRPAAVLRGVPRHASARLPAWPHRPFAPDRDGTILLPRSDRPTNLQIRTVGDEGTAVDDLWLESGEQRAFAVAPVTWRPIAVRDRDRKAIAGALVVTLRAGPGRPSVAAISRTDRDGSACVRDGLEQGRVAVVAGSFALAAASPRDDIVTLEPAGLARLRIVDERGQAVPGARVETYMDAVIDQVAVTDGRGGVTFRQLPRDTVPILIDHDQHPPLEGELEFRADGVVEFALGRGLALRGVVTCSDRPTLAGVLVEARPTLGLPHMRPRLAPVDARGRFSFRGLPDVPMTLFARGVERGRTWSGTVDGVQPGGDPVTLSIHCDDPTPGDDPRRDR